MTNKVKIAIDAMGGENSPKKIVDGIEISLKSNKDNFFYLYGNQDLLEKDLSKKELCEAINIHAPDFMFIEAPIGKDPDQRNYIVSNEKIEDTGFKPVHSLDAGIQELIKGYTMIKNTKHGNV